MKADKYRIAIITTRQGRSFHAQRISGYGFAEVDYETLKTFATEKEALDFLKEAMGWDRMSEEIAPREIIRVPSQGDF